MVEISVIIDCVQLIILNAQMIGDFCHNNPGGDYPCRKYCSNCAQNTCSDSDPSFFDCSLELTFCSVIDV